MGPPPVVVSNGSQRFHLYQTALAYEQAGLLRRLIAGWYLKNPTLMSLLQSPLVARVAGPNLVKRLRSRRQEALAPEHVVSLVIPDLIERLGRTRLEKLFQPGFLSYCSMRAFGRLSRKYLEGASLFHVRSGYGRGAMAAARRGGAVCLVDHSIADPGFIAETLKEEAARWQLPYEFPHWHWRCVSQDLDEADHILANSEFVRDNLVAWRGIPPAKISVLPWSVDLSRFSPAVNRRGNGKFRMLFAGEIGLRKGVLYLLAAIKKLRLPQAELILVGGITEIDKLIARSGFEFRLIPGLPQEDLVALFQGASVFVFPSLIEGSARVVQEAMACGLPVITTPNAGSIVRDGEEGFVVPIRDEEALCQRLLELYQRPGLRQEMGLKARAAAESHFKPEAYGAGLVELYTALVGERQDVETG